MIQRFLGCFCLLVFILSAPYSLQAQTIRVLTYNIHHGEDVNGRLDLEQIAAVIKAARPDVVALQEVDSMTNRTGRVDQLKTLATMTGMHFFFGKNMDYDGGGYGVGILTHLPIRRAFVTRLPHLPKSEPRVTATVELPLRKNRTFLFSTIHLDYVSDPTERMAQAQKLLEVFSTITTPSIFAGDFNAPPDETTMKDHIFNFYGETDPTGQMFTYPSGTPEVKIDYVLVSKGHQWKIKQYHVIDEKVASDHRPVLSVIRLK